MLPTLSPGTCSRDATAGATLLSPPVPSPVARTGLKQGDGDTLQPWGRGQWGTFMGRRDRPAAPCHPPTFRKVVLVGSNLELHSTCR